MNTHLQISLLERKKKIIIVIMSFFLVNDFQKDSLIDQPQRCLTIITSLTPYGVNNIENCGI